MFPSPTHTEAWYVSLPHTHRSLMLTQRMATWTLAGQTPTLSRSSWLESATSAGDHHDNTSEHYTSLCSSCCAESNCYNYKAFFYCWVRVVCYMQQFTFTQKNYTHYSNIYTERRRQCDIIITFCNCLYLDLRSLLFLKTASAIITQRTKQTALSLLQLQEYALGSRFQVSISVRRRRRPHPRPDLSPYHQRWCLVDWPSVW